MISATDNNITSFSYYTDDEQTNLMQINIDVRLHSINYIVQFVKYITILHELNYTNSNLY